MVYIKIKIVLQPCLGYIFTTKKLILFLGLQIFKKVVKFEKIFAHQKRA